MAPKTKLTQMHKLKDAEQIAEWRSRIDRGIKWRQRTSGRNDIRWKRYKKYYRGDWGGVKDLLGAQDSLNDIVLSEYMPVNRIFSFVRSVMPRVYFRNPGVVVTKGMIIDGVDDAPVIQSVANYLIKVNKLKYTLKRAVLSTALTGVGITKTGMGSQYVMTRELSETEDTKPQRLEYSARIRGGLPWATNVEPGDFVVPWGTKEFDFAPWCAQQVWRLTADAQADTNLAHRDKIEPTACESTHDSEIVPGESDKCSWSRLWEIHDKRSGRMYIMSDTSDKYHFNDSDILAIGNLPYRILIFNVDLDTMWSVAAARIMEPQQLELNDIRTQQVKHRRREVTKLLVDPEADRDGNLEALNDATEPMAIVKIPDPRKNVMELSTGMPRDLPEAGREADDDLRTEVGAGRNQAGEVSTGRRTAEEIGTVRQASEIRNDERRDMTTDHFAGTVDDMVQIGFVHMTPEMVKRIAGAVWHERDAEMLPYNLGLEVNPEEAKPVNSLVQRQDALSLLQAFAQDPYIDPFRLRMDVLKQYGKDPNDWLNPQLVQLVQKILTQGQENVDA